MLVRTGKLDNAGKKIREIKAISIIQNESKRIKRS